MNRIKPVLKIGTCNGFWEKDISLTHRYTIDPQRSAIANQASLGRNGE